MTAKKEEKSVFRQDAQMIALFIALVLTLSMLCLYFYWQNYENQRVAKVKDNVTAQVLRNLRATSTASGSNPKLNIKDPSNAILENTGIASVDSKSDQIIFFDKAGNKLPLKVIRGSVLQKVTISPTGKANWTNVNVQGVPSGVKGTVIYNQNHEIINLVFMVNR